MAKRRGKKSNSYNQGLRLKEYMKKKDYNSLGINLTQQKFAKSLQRVRKFEKF
jgi:hypothetical protein